MWSSNKSGSHDIYWGGEELVWGGLGLPAQLTEDEFIDRTPVLSPVLGDTLFVAWESYRSSSWDIMGAAVKIYIGDVKPGTENANPQRFSLSQNYPNPFNTSTSIRYHLSQPSFVTLEIYNLLGQKVRTLMAGLKSKGYYQISWDGTDNHGSPVPAGLYIYCMRTKDRTQSRKLLLLK